MNIATICGVMLADFTYGRYGRFGSDGIIIIAFVFFARSLIVWYFDRKMRKKSIKETTKQDIVKENVCTASGIEIDYSSLYKELTEKCNPSNLLQPYNANKVEASIAIYFQLEKNKDNINELIKLRNRAIKELGVKFSSQDLFEKLSQVFNPSNFMDKNYDDVKLCAANKIYTQIQEYKDDIIELEKIAFKYNADTSPACNEENCDEINMQSTDSSDEIIRYFFLGIFCLMFGLAGKVSNQENAEQGNGTFINQYSTEKFCISYPSTWEKAQQNIDSVNTETAVRIMGKRKDNYSFSPSINIMVLKEKRIESTDSLAKISHKQLIDTNLNSCLIDICKSSLSGYDSSLLKQTIFSNEYKILQYRHIVKKEDNTTFIITASMDYDNNRSQKAEIDKILSSFVIK